MKMDEEVDVYREIPGLGEPDVKGKKGKKKNNSKKTLPLQTFLHNKENGVQELNKANLNEEETAILESCHSYIFDWLNQRGPCNAMDSQLQQEVNNFPAEAKQVMAKVGGYRAFILCSKDLVVVDKIVAAKLHFAKAKEMAFKEIYNNLPGKAGDHTQFWNSNSPIRTSTWTPGSDSGSTIQYHQASSQDDTTVGGGKGVIGGGVPGVIGGKQGVIGSSLNKTGIFNSGPKFGGEPAGEGGLSDEQEKRIWTLTAHNNQLIKQLNEKDKQLQHLSGVETKVLRLERENEQYRLQSQEYREEVEKLKGEIQRMNGESRSRESSLEFQRNDSSRNILTSLKNQNEELTLRNLSQMDISGPMNNMSEQPPSFSTNSSRPGGGFGGLGLGGLDNDHFGLRSMSMNSGADLKPVTSSMFGAIGTDFTRPPAISKSASASTIGMNGSGVGQGQHPSNFLGGFQPSLNRPVFPPMVAGLSTNPLGPGLTSNISTLSNSSLGFSNPLNSSLSSSLLPQTSFMAQGSLGLGQSPFGSNPGHFGSNPGSFGSNPGPFGSNPGSLGSFQGLNSAQNNPGFNSSSSLSKLASSVSGGGQAPIGSQGSAPSSGPGTPAPTGKSSSASAIRQEQLVRKLVSSIPGSSEDSVKRYIQVLRDQHGKLSGWPTSKIVAEITQLMQQG